MKRGGKRAGAGRSYSPWDRMRLAERCATLKYEFLKAGRSKPGLEALLTLHAEEHPDGSGNFESTKRLCITGRCESILLAENDPWIDHKLVPTHRRLPTFATSSRGALNLFDFVHHET